MGGPINVNDLIIHRSDRFAVKELSVTIHRFPPNAWSSFTPEQDAYTFWYRPRAERGQTWLTVPELGLDHHHVSRNHLLISPPALPVYGEQEEAEGIVANFSFNPRFFEGLGGEMGLSEFISERPWHHFFAIDQRIEALCRLLMEETEEQCPNGPLYFEPLARALALRVLGTVRDRHGRAWRVATVPPGVRHAVERLETDFADAISLGELATMAQMSRSHFALMFREFTGHTPHQYLLLVRLNHARKLIGQGNSSSAVSLAEIAAASGFCDQAHLSRHFRRVFGTTPAAFRSQHSILDAGSKQSATFRHDDPALHRQPSSANVPAFVNPATGRF
jgi:AraC family transcriptional regulator